MVRPHDHKPTHPEANEENAYTDQVRHNITHGPVQGTKQKLEYQMEPCNIVSTMYNYSCGMHMVLFVSWQL